MKTANRRPEPEYKAYGFRGELDENVLKGGPSVMGVLDHGRDVIFPGAYKNVLKTFLQRGFVPDSHDWTWDSLLAMPVVAEERGNTLYSEAIFHSTQRAQDARIVAKERLDHGLDVGLSVGYLPSAKDTYIFDTGEELLEWAEDNGYDLKLFDVKGIKADKRPMRGIVDMAELLEYSLTPAPMNVLARASEAKSIAVAKPDFASIASRFNLPAVPAGFSAEDYANACLLVLEGADDIAAERKRREEAEAKAMVETRWGSASVASYFDGVEERAAVDAMLSVDSRFWRCVYDCIFGMVGEEEPPTLESRIDAIEEAFDLYRTKALALAKAILSLEPEEASEAKSRFERAVELKDRAVEAVTDGTDLVPASGEAKTLTREDVDGISSIRTLETTLKKVVSGTVATGIVAKAKTILLGELGGPNAEPSGNGNTDPATEPPIPVPANGVNPPAADNQSGKKVYRF